MLRVRSPCQVSTTPHMEHRMFLGVVQPKTVILGPKERYIEKASTINRPRTIQAGPLNLNPSFVFWNYNGKIITYDRERGGTVVISDRFEPTEFLPDFWLCVVTFLIFLRPT